MKSAAWRLKHIADADAALEAAGKALEPEIVMHSQVIDARIARANALTNLARAHYRAVEVDILTRVLRQDQS